MIARCAAFSAESSFWSTCAGAGASRLQAGDRTSSARHRARNTGADPNLARNLSRARRLIPGMHAEDSLEPWSPSGGEPWDRERAALLARRAGFGASPREIEELCALGLEGATSRL